MWGNEASRRSGRADRTERVLFAQAARREIHVSGVALDAEEALVAHSWPGNLRELRNVLECALLTGTETVIRRADLRLNRGGDSRGQAAAEPTADALKEIEWQHIRQVLADEAGSVARAAARLKIPRSTLYQKLKLQRGRLGSVAPDESEGRSGSRR